MYKKYNENENMKFEKESNYNGVAILLLCTRISQNES
jgi:hypothetical protein